MEALLPHNIDAECAVLGSILIDPEAIVQLADFLKPEHFYRDAHRSIYEAVLHLYAQQQPADLTTLSDILDRMDKLEQLGGISYLVSLVNGVPTSGNAHYYGRIVQRTATMRRLIHGAGEIAAAAFAQDENALHLAEQIVFQVAQGTQGKPPVDHVAAVDSYMTNLIELHEQSQSGTMTGVPTGFPLLDKKLGGLRKSKMYVLAARPGEGKTALALNIAHTAIKARCHVLFFSLEMDEEELMQRLVSRESGVDSTHLRDATFEEGEWDVVMRARDRLENMSGKLWIDDTPANTLVAMRSKSMRQQMEHGLDLIIVDYLQLAQSDMLQTRKQQDRRLEVEEVSRGLKNLARELKVPVLALAQLNREVENRANRKPKLSDLREAGGIEQDCDAAFFIYKAPETHEEATSYRLDLLIEKHRNGPRGSVPMHFEGSQTRFYAVKEEKKV